jgi:all-trans-retinol dehydrogenase (NAD+)
MTMGGDLYFWVLDLSKAELTYKVNTISHFYTTKEFLPAMLQANSGHIVTVSSMAGKVGNPYMTDYCASKWAAIGFTESLRVELKSMNSKVRTTVINPFYINTGMFKGVSINPLTMFTGMLDEGYVANRIIWAIRQGEEEVCLPWVHGVLADLLRVALPSSLRDWVAIKLGFAGTMKTFVGRGPAPAKH